MDPQTGTAIALSVVWMTLLAIITLIWLLEILYKENRWFTVYSMTEKIGLVISHTALIALPIAISALD